MTMKAMSPERAALPATRGHVRNVFETIVDGAGKAFKDRDETIAALELRVKALEGCLMALEQVLLPNYVGLALNGKSYPKGTIARDKQGSLWIAVEDDDGSGTTLEPPTWQHYSLSEAP